MTWLNKLLTRAKASAATREAITHTLQANGKGVMTGGSPYFSPILLQRGKWVRYADRVGILADVDMDGVCEVHFVNNRGESTEGSLKVLATDLRIARYLEIPAPRRPIDPMVAASLGYI